MIIRISDFIIINKNQLKPTIIQSNIQVFHRIHLSSYYIFDSLDTPNKWSIKIHSLLISQNNITYLLIFIR